MIDAEKATYPIAMMCTLAVSRSTFYAWRDRAETATSARRRDLAGLVRRVFDASRGDARQKLNKLMAEAAVAEGKAAAAAADAA